MMSCASAKLVCRSARMLGSEILTMKASMMAMNAPVRVTANPIQRPEDSVRLRCAVAQRVEADFAADTGGSRHFVGVTIGQEQNRFDELYYQMTFYPISSTDWLGEQHVESSAKR